MGAHPLHGYSFRILTPDFNNEKDEPTNSNVQKSLPLVSVNPFLDSNLGSNSPSTLPETAPRLCATSYQLPDSDSDFEDDIKLDVDNSLKLCITKELQEGIPLLLEEFDVESQVLNLCSALMPSVISRRDFHHSKDKNVGLGEDRVISHGIDLLQLKKAYKSGSFDLKIKVDYSNSKDLKSHLANGSPVKSLLSVSVRGRLAVGEGDKVAIYDVGQLIGQTTISPVTADKTNVKHLSKNVVRFEIL